MDKLFQIILKIVQHLQRDRATIGTPIGIRPFGSNDSQFLPHNGTEFHIAGKPTVDAADHNASGRANNIQSILECGMMTTVTRLMAS